MKIARLISILLIALFLDTFNISFSRTHYSLDHCTIKSPLDPGTVNFTGTTHIFYNTDPGLLQQTPASGGSGSYQYQWQSSPDANTWSDVPGATNVDFDPEYLTATTYFRRSVFDGSQTFYTGHVLIAICALMDPGNLTYNNTTPLDNGTDPGYIQEYGGVGGDCNDNSNNVYQWESSTDGGNTWNIISNSNQENYDPGPLAQTIQFRRKLSGGNQSGYTNIITIPVLPALDPGSLSFSGNVATGDDPGNIPEIPASGGRGSYNYVWERSVDGTNWSFVAFTENYDPGPLMQTTMFKRYVDDNKFSKITNTITINVGVPLPLKFVSFSGKPIENSVLLNWITAEEKNVKSFEVEISNDGSNFISNGYIAFQVNTSNYSYLDSKPNNSVNYYRIKEIDNDGKISYSKIIKIVLKQQLLSVTLNKNPFINNIDLNIHSPKKQTIEIEISNALSQTIYHRSEYLYEGNTNLNINSQAWQKGAYYIQIKGTNNRIILKLIKM